MRTLEITIVKREGVNSFFALSGMRQLFQFEPRGLDGYLGKGQWFFWPRGNFNPVMKKGKFPMEYFINLCKSMNFIINEEDEMPDEVKIISGEKYLK